MKNAFLWLILLMAPIASGTLTRHAGAAPPEDRVEDYRIGPGDSLSISVFGFYEFKQTIRVSNSGKIHVPRIGILKVIGMTPHQLQDEIARQLIQRDLIKDPHVQVGIAEYRAHTVYILGEVIMPGQFLMTHEMYLADLLALSQGFNEYASPIGYLYRTAVDAPGTDAAEMPRDSSQEEAIEIDFQKLFDGTRPDLNIRLRGGDVLYCPQRRRIDYYVVGEVRNPGVFEMQFNQETLITQAIAKAGGPSKTAKLSKGLLVRYNQSGERQELAVDFKAVLEGKKPDFAVLPNDVIFIPGSSAKTLAYGILGIIPRVALTATTLP